MKDQLMIQYFVNYFSCSIDFRSPNDSRLFIIQEHDPEALSMSFDELQLFSDSKPDLVSVSTSTKVVYTCTEDPYGKLNAQ